MVEPATFAELLAHPGVEEVCELRGRFGFLAFHGGNLERVTDVIAERAAWRSGASLYVVRQPPPLRAHISSNQVTSPALDAFLAHVDVTIAIHGYGRSGLWTSLLLGGRNRLLAADLARHLRPALPGYSVVDDMEDIPVELRGLHSANPVNRAPGGGVQLELPPRVRGLTPHAMHEPRVDGCIPITDALIDALVLTAQSWTPATPATPGAPAPDPERGPAPR